MNIFRHWFLWSAIEVAPGVYDWADYDRQLDLAAENGIKTIIAEMITAAPEWAFRQYAHARLETRDGRRVESKMSGSCVTGGFPGLCLDNDDYRAGWRSASCARSCSAIAIIPGWAAMTSGTSATTAPTSATARPRRSASASG